MTTRWGEATGRGFVGSPRHVGLHRGGHRPSCPPLPFRGQGRCAPRLSGHVHLSRNAHPQAFHDRKCLDLWLVLSRGGCLRGSSRRWGAAAVLTLALTQPEPAPPPSEARAGAPAWGTQEPSLAISWGEGTWWGAVPAAPAPERGAGERSQRESPSSARCVLALNNRVTESASGVSVHTERLQPCCKTYSFVPLPVKMAINQGGSEGALRRRPAPGNGCCCVSPVSKLGLTQGEGPDPSG